MEISSSGKILGATVKGIDLAQPLSDRDCKRILRALGAYGVLCFPDQRLETQELARFGRMFGELEINIANQFHEPGFPEVMYFYAHHWAQGDVLMWDNVGTVHNAVADYGLDEPRYMRRVQVMASKDNARVSSR
jgi:taurine dioxygenase